MAAPQDSNVLGDSTSEVGTDPNAHNRSQSPILQTKHENWGRLFELQHRNMLELVKYMRESKDDSTKITLPEFNPDKTDADAEAWCNTVDLCLTEETVTGSKLIILLSKALKGAAATWLAQNSFANATWPELKNLFLTRFGTVETPAATVFKILNGNPNDGENISSYVSRITSTLVNRWRNLSTEQIATTLALAHVARTDAQIQRLAFTTEITTRRKLQQELMAFVYKKRSLPSSEKNDTGSEAKRARYPRTCYNCGKTGHLAYECRRAAASKENPTAVRQDLSSSSTSMQRKEPSQRTIICYRCGQSGHVAPRCPAKDAKPAEHKEPIERRVETCTVSPAAGDLYNLGEKFPFYFDSGAECSLIKESVAQKFSGKRFHDTIVLKGIGKDSLVCHLQILSTVIIQTHSIELLFHVVPDQSLSNDILIGQDLVALGFTIEISPDRLVINKTKIVQYCEVGKKANNFQDIDTDIPIEYKPKLLSLLESYSDNFVEGVPTSRVTSGQLEIKLIDASRTVQRRPYRLSMDERTVVRDKIRDLMNAGVVRESCSPFSSPVLLVKKKDGTDRLCIDYRELNSNTVPDRYPLPLIGDQIQRLVGANYFSSLDMASGYHQIPIHPDSIERTAFVTPDGQFEYVTMPFGLRNAPSVYQRAINKALGELAESFAVCYIDDIIIPSVTTEQGIERLRLVIEALTKAGFSFNLKKCAFLKIEVDYLGYHVSSGQIRPNLRKIQALTQLPPPKTATQLRQFIGLASYFRQFIPGFSQISAPLYRLTSKKGSIDWDLQLEDIRKKIVSILTNKPVLTIFDPNFPIELHTDASAEGYGAMLIQKVDNKPHVIEYYSKRTSPCESKYHSYELETLAVVNAIKHFKHYLQNRKFLVVTDCNAIKASKTKMDLTPRVHRWWCFLQTFDFDIEYRPGKRMEHVDFLSRNPLPNKPISQVIQKQINLTEITDNWLQAEQQKDTEILDLILKLKNNTLDKDISKTYEIRRGVLHRKVERNNRSFWLPIVPRAFQWAIINNVHESLMHLGWEKTLEKVFSHYWFPHMNKYVRKFVENCITCRLSKCHSGRVQAELHSIPKVTVPWHTIHIDATGKLSGKNDTKEYVFVLIDAFTKYTILYHTKNIDSSNAIQALKYSVSLFGAPSRVIADQGRCFASKDFKQFCDSHCIHLHLIATGTSRANGQVERVMSTLKNMLTSIETENNRSWQDALPEVQIALNSTFCRVTKSSPLELLIGKSARPLSLMIPATDEHDSVDLDLVREQAAQSILTNANADKVRFDKSKAKIKNFKVGDYVLLENHERNQTKLEPKFKGPYLVAQVLDGDRYLLKALNSKRMYKYAHDRLRPLPECYVPIELDPNLSGCAADGIGE